MSLEEFLQKKGQEYAPFDPARAPRIFGLFAQDFLQGFKPKVLHLVGTNGKGSTGRMIARGIGKNYLHFTSPHLFFFNERFYRDGSYISMQELERIHQLFFKKSYMQELSYFEYATFLALFLAKDLDFLILEAGLGGEYDSTNVIKDKISIFTQIGFDHIEILGETIEQIAQTKLNSMGSVAFLGIQKYPQVKGIAHQISKTKNTQLFEITSLYQANLPLFLQENLALAVRVLEFLGIAFCIDEIIQIDLLGRMQKYASNIYLDVGHNVECALALAKELGDEKINLVFNAYIQKDIPHILEALRPNIKIVEIIAVEEERIIPRDKLEEILKSLAINYRDFQGIEDKEKYLVFGSFSVVREFLKREQDER